MIHPCFDSVYRLFHDSGGSGYLLLKALKHIANKTKLKLTNAYLIQEYEQQLSNYMDMKDTEENMRFIRHDLINHIQKDSLNS